MFSKTLLSLVILSFYASSEAFKLSNKPHTNSGARHSLRSSTPTGKYSVTLQLGTPPSTFTLFVDTASGDTWVPSTQCLTTACPKTSLSGSSTLVTNATQTWETDYLVGNVTGIAAQDTLTVDTPAAQGLQLPKFQFGLVDAASQDFNLPYDGVLGAAQLATSDTGFVNPVVALNQAGLIPTAIISYHGGDVLFGPAQGIDPTSVVSWANQDQNGYWSGTADSIFIDGKSTLSNRTVVFNSEGTLISVPFADASALHLLIPGSRPGNDQGVTILPCNTNSSLAISIQGKDFTLSGKQLTYLPIDPTKPDQDCFSAIAGADLGEDDVWLLGTAFLDTVYLSTDFTQNQITLGSL